MTLARPPVRYAGLVMLLRVRCHLQDKIPVISDLIELVGIGVTGW